jgi:hypothetical protein
MKHVMFDLETMSLRPNAAILSIGAVEMDLVNLRLGKQFYSTVDLESCLAVGLHKDEATAQWWAEQSPAARDALEHGATPLKESLSALSEWLAIYIEPDIRQRRVWSCGASFDIVILESAYTACEKEIPWKFNNHMCYRTKKNEHKLTVPNAWVPVLKHHALEDAVAQALHLLDIYRFEQRPRTITERFMQWLREST